MTNAEKINMILEVSEELLIKKEFDELVADGMRFIHDEFTEEENRENLKVNLN